MKIAEALLLRKQLEAKVRQLEPIKQLGEQGLFEVKLKRINVNDQTDEVSFQVPKVTLEDVTKTYDHYASELRKLDSSIQQANWIYDVEYKMPATPKSETKKGK